MKVKTNYLCEVCGTSYETAEEAERCEANHKLCDCEKSSEIVIAYSVIGYGEALEGTIDFENKTIRVFIDDDDYPSHVNAVSIKYCPFCGREL